MQPKSSKMSPQILLNGFKMLLKVTRLDPWRRLCYLSWTQLENNTKKQAQREPQGSPNNSQITQNPIKTDKKHTETPDLEK